ncbi:exported hypothetical protein [Rubrivivax sp. A210]|uniref:hypothetical protein n=1 Tax=Rubrivivax sp. A210 TaxID=2772301 RepID=UPI001917B84F|nr:hypothetical protein [Rubrivivax sp. A210]CAD5373310.1 exported hypothetical protein [Rubrivivax sp. A210]
MKHAHTLVAAALLLGAAAAEAAPIVYDFTGRFTMCGGNLGPKQCNQLISAGSDGVWSLSGSIRFDDSVAPWQVAAPFNTYSMAGLAQFEMQMTIEGTHHARSTGAYTPTQSNPGSAKIEVRDSPSGDGLSLVDSSPAIDFEVPAGYTPFSFPGQPHNATWGMYISLLPLGAFSSKALPATPPDINALGVQRTIGMQFSYTNARDQFFSVYWNGQIDTLTLGSASGAGSSGTHTVPEPTSALLVLCGLLAAAPLRQRAMARRAAA